MDHRIYCVFVGAVALAAAGCSDDSRGPDESPDGSPNSDAGTGGSPASGGAAGSSGTGGDAGTGGAGGSSGTGGNAGTGGNSGDASAGGAAGSGGAAGGDAGGDPPGDGAAPDSSEDAGIEADAAPSNPWAGCPSSDDFVAEPSWSHALEVTADAVYCSTFEETRTLKEELLAKAQLRIAPHTYRLPGAAHQDLGLPACLRFADGAVLGAAAGAATYNVLSFEGESTHSYNFTQPSAESPPGGVFRLSFSRVAPAAETPSFLLDGSEVDNDAMTSFHSLSWCETSDPSCFPGLRFDSCTHAGSTLHRHTVTLGGAAGTVEFELRLGESFAGTEPGAFVRASGTFKGAAFDQRDYFKLVYNPTHHHWSRDFAVFFDRPIDGACGIEVTHLERFEPGDEPDAAYTIDCELERLDTLSVQSHTLDVE